jgi:hypothetical protein
MYKLFREVTEEYGERLQLIIVDNDLPTEIAGEAASSIVLTLSQESRLISGVTATSVALFEEPDPAATD